MRRKKENKRVLRPGNGNYNKKSRRPSFNRNNNQKSIKSSFMKNNANNRRHSQNRNYNKKQNKRSGKTVIIMIIILLAFIIGAGAGVLMSFEQQNNATAGNNTTHIENVTVEMTTHLNESDDEVVFDEADAVDFNENQSAKILGVEDNPYYNNVEHLY